VLACLATLALATLPALTASSTHPSRHGLQSHLATSLPVTLAPAVSASIGASDRSFWPIRHGSLLLSKGGGIQSTFTKSGAELRISQGALGLSLASVGRGQRLNPVTAVAPTTTTNQVLYRHGSVTEFYRNGPYGLEQSFTVRQRPQAGTGSLVLAVGVKGSLVPKQVGSQVLFRTRSGAPALRYGELSAIDATGRRLPAQLQVRAGTLQLRIDDRNGHYPLRIDPFIQQGEKLTGGGEIGTGQFGYDVALSGDGSTALVGANGDNNLVGAAWVFTRSGSTWTQQGPKLIASDELGAGQFGTSVGLSSDGSTALIGAEKDSGGVGAAWVFTRSGSTWTQQGGKLTGSGASGNAWFGGNAALSSDGDTALIGGLDDGGHAGAAWVFTRSGSTWTQQGEKLTGSGESGEGDFGARMALSANGNTALISGPQDAGDRGAAWAFTRSGATWTQQGPKFTSSEATAQGGYGFGSAVGLSSDGNTALIGDQNMNNAAGVAWVFTWSGTSWMQQGGPLTGGGESGAGSFGASVALSSDGGTALIGGYTDVAHEEHFGAAWVFTRSGTTWAQQGEKLTGGGETSNGYFGSSVALSANGNTAFIGGPVDNGDVGSAWVFVYTPPTITKLTPTKGPAGGGTTVTITGTHLLGTTAVRFGAVPAASFIVRSATSIAAVTPAETSRTVDVTVTSPEGTSPISSLDHFKFGPPTVTGVSPNAGSKEGGATVTVTGTGFGLGAEATLFKFGTTEATTANCTSITTCTVVVPSHLVGTVDVKATVSGMSSPKATADQFTYN